MRNGEGSGEYPLGAEVQPDADWLQKGLPNWQSRGAVALHHALHAVVRSLFESRADGAWSTHKLMLSKHLEDILQLLYLLHTLLCGPPSAMARQPVCKYGLTCACVAGGVVGVGNVVSIFVRGLRTQVHLTVDS